MKIIKKLSLLSTIAQRTIAPKPYDPWLQRYLFKRKIQKQLTVQQQLIKYGYTFKPLLTPLRLVVLASSILLAFLTHIYLITIYKNELKVRHKYRIQQQQHSSIQLRLRRLLLRFYQYIQKNIFATQLVISGQGKQLVPVSEGLLRTQQYRHYMENRDKKFQFMDIGVMERFPYPQIKDQ